MVTCRHFVLPQRVEDRVLEVLVRKTDTIRRELGSMARVLDGAVERTLRGGIRHDRVDALVRELEGLGLDAEARRALQEELEGEAADRRKELQEEIARCERMLEDSRRRTAFDEGAFRHALEQALRLAGAEGGLRPDPGCPVPGALRLPDLEPLAREDPSWIGILDALRKPMPRGKRLADWRREAPVRPVVFRDPGVLTDEVVHLHLEQRLAARLLARFRSQGFLRHDIHRACLVQSEDGVPRIVLLGRLALFGEGAERLHEEVVAVAARWSPPAARAEPLRPYARDAHIRALEMLEEALRRRVEPPPEVARRVREGLERDVAELRPHLEKVADEAGRAAAERLAERGEREAAALCQVLERQRERVRAELARRGAEVEQLTLFSVPERRQLQADLRAWRERLERFDRDLQDEPARIRAFYQVRARRFEPVGAVVLWPAGGAP